jgi:hypothetical protein
MSGSSSLASAYRKVHQQLSEGATAVVPHHLHCLAPMELYSGITLQMALCNCAHLLDPVALGKWPKSLRGFPYRLRGIGV